MDSKQTETLLFRWSQHSCSVQTRVYCHTSLNKPNRQTHQHLFKPTIRARFFTTTALIRRRQVTCPEQPGIPEHHPGGAAGAGCGCGKGCLSYSAATETRTHINSRNRWKDAVSNINDWIKGFWHVENQKTTTGFMTCQCSRLSAAFSSLIVTKDCFSFSSGT